MADFPRNPSARSPARRHQEIRSTAYAEENGATLVHVQNAPGAEGIDLPVSEPTEAGLVFRTSGVDALLLLVEVEVASATAISVRPQASWLPGQAHDKRSASPFWFDVLEDVAGDGVLVPKVYTAPVVGPTARVAFRIPVRGTYMRLFLWGAGASADRATVRVIRSQDGRGN